MNETEGLSPSATSDARSGGQCRSGLTVDLVLLDVIEDDLSGAVPSESDPDLGRRCRRGSNKIGGVLISI